MAKTEPAYQKWELRNGEPCPEGNGATAKDRQLQTKPGWLSGFESLLKNWRRECSNATAEKDNLKARR